MNKSYTPLYRKYRPQKIEEIVGQEHIKKALANAIEMKRISHAYLFTGPRGTGKTSTARIFAKSLNCINGPTVSPCNECENCRNITNSIPIDVIEMDAASNRSVSDAEEIIQNVAMAPVHSRYKIYIIDEVHMLTSTAFNALLKTLEEPPENVIFILATTEVHKVLDTIKSRCQRFDFKRITTSDIANHLRNISNKEEINITDDALFYIAQNSAGGMRDSIALLDQLSVLNSTDSEIGVDDINKLLGRLSFDSLNSLFGAISSSSQQQALEILNDIYNMGNEPSQILSNFLEFLRNALIIKSVGSDAGNSVQLNEEQIKVLNSSVSALEVHQLVSLTDKCSAYIKELKLSSNPKLWLDIAILDMANLTQNTKLEDLQKRLSTLEGGQVMRPAAYNTPPAPVIKSEIQKPKPQALATSVQSNPSQPADKVQVNALEPREAAQITSNVDGAKALWGRFLDNISSVPSRAILKQQALPVKISPDEIVLTIKNPVWLKKFSPEGDKYEFLTAAAGIMFEGGNTKVTVRAPQAGDDKLRSDMQSGTQKESPRQVSKTLIIKKDESEALSSDDIKNQNEAAEEDIEQQTKMPEEQKIISSISPSDAAFHSDNVNMVMQLFEGKIIE